VSGPHPVELVVRRQIRRWHAGLLCPSAVRALARQIVRGLMAEGIVPDQELSHD
jgi:hypothetical protein